MPYNSFLELIFNIFYFIFILFIFNLLEKIITKVIYMILFNNWNGK